LRKTRTLSEPLKPRTHFASKIVLSAEEVEEQKKRDAEYALSFERDRADPSLEEAKRFLPGLAVANAKPIQDDNEPLIKPRVRFLDYWF
jgi:hypothetical protein